MSITFKGLIFTFHKLENVWRIGYILNIGIIRLSATLRVLISEETIY